MKTLMSEEFAPITSSIGFLKAPLSDAAAAMASWRRKLYGSEMLIGPVRDGFPEVLTRLEPLALGSPNRHLLVRAGPDWTAYFDCGLHGSDPGPPIHFLSRTMDVCGVIVTTVPHRDRGIQTGRFGSVQFSLYGPENDGQWLNSIRSVSAHFESRWEFRESGRIQPFEELEAYRSRRVRDRLTSEMVERYCQALGIDVFNPNFYGPDAVFFERRTADSGHNRSMSLADAQRLQGIHPIRVG